jgi:alkylation response protein AidB-like acyl-CoA dehydrogenase
MRRTLFEAEHEAFRESVRRFLEKEILPHREEWDTAGIVPREVFTLAGDAGFLGTAIPEEYGGGGSPDYRFNVVLSEEVQRLGLAGPAAGLNLHTDITTPYYLKLANDEQKRRWLPGIASGELITAIAMTEPGTGSDLAGIATTAIRDGDHYVVNGAKTFISNGINSDIVITAVKTDPTQRHAGVSLIVIERGMPGFERGRNLDKLGQHAADTAELSFSDVRVPVANLLGEEGQGFKYLVNNLPQERLQIAVAAVAASRTVLDTTLEYVKERKAFGKPIGSFQHSKFVLAELHTEVTIAERFVDDCVRAHNAGEFDATEASMAKWWTTELQGRVTDTCVQLHGGYGYMTEYSVTRAYADARISRIYGGTTEIMKEVIGRSLGL